MTGSRSGGAAISGGGQVSGTVFGTRPSNWNRYPRQFDTNVYQRNSSAARHFHWRSYNRPNGWYYQRWGFGQIFPRIFWARDFWLSDYWMFDLPIPPYGYVWVRYGDDAVMINRRTGRISAGRLRRVLLGSRIATMAPDKLNLLGVIFRRDRNHVDRAHTPHPSCYLPAWRLQRSLWRIWIRLRTQGHRHHWRHPYHRGRIARAGSSLI